MPCRADGSVRGVGIPSASLGAGSSTPRNDSLCESVGYAQDDNLVGLKPGSLFKELNAALKRRSSTVPPTPLFHGTPNAALPRYPQRRSSTVPPTPLFHGTPNAALPRYPQRRSSAVLCAAVGRALLDWTAEGRLSPHNRGNFPLRENVVNRQELHDWGYVMGNKGKINLELHANVCSFSYAV
jgi:hypothetical protein